MAEFNSNQAAEDVMAHQPPPPPLPVPEPVPMPDYMPIVTSSEPEPTTGSAAGFEEGFSRGYGAPAPRPRPADPAPAEPVGSPEWVAAIRTMAVADQTRLQAVMAAHPDQFHQIMAAVSGPDPATAQLGTVTDGPDYDAEPDEEGDDVDDIDPRLAARGLRGWMNRSLRTRLPKSSKEKVADLVDYAVAYVHLAIDRGQPIVIGVTSYKGGCGKTRISVVLAKLLAEIITEYLDEQGLTNTYRGSVLAMDVDLHGMLQPCSVDSAEISTDVGVMTTLCSRLSLGYSPDELDIGDYAHDAGGGYHFIAGNHFGKAASITPDGFRAALDMVRMDRNRYPVIIVDMSQVVATELHATVLQSIDGLLMITPPDEAEANFLDGTRALLADRPGGVNAEHLIKQRVTVINHNKPMLLDRSFRSEDVAARLKLYESLGATSENPRGSDISEVPWDWHIASRRLVSIDRLRPATRTAALLAAGALYDTILNLNDRE